MAGKNWSDYWKKYKSSVTHTDKPKDERPTITISPKVPKLSGLNMASVLMIILALGVLGLGIWQGISSRTIGILQENRYQ